MARHTAGNKSSLSSVLSRIPSSSNETLKNNESASAYAKDKEIKALKIENEKLRKELKNTRSLYEQLTMENSHEKFDERRITLLKSQIIQLERQIMSMTEAISSRTVILSEVENALGSLSNKWREFIGMELKGPDVRVPRAEIMEMVHMAESARIKLFKNIENCTLDSLAQPLLFLNKFVCPNQQETVTLLDVAAGNLKHLNLAHVANLETKLSYLYKDLMQLHSIIDDNPDKDSCSLPVSSHICHVIKNRYSTQVLKSCARIKDCCGDLLLISLLYPSAPWPPLQKNCLKNITCETVMQSLPALPRGKFEQVQRIIKALMKAVNHKNNLQQSQIKGLQEETQFHKAVYNLQISYSDSLLDAVRKGYVDFEKSTADILLHPLKDVMEAYLAVKSSHLDESAFRNFLAVFKSNEEKLAGALDQLLPLLNDSDGASVEALSHFGEDFNNKLHRMVQKTQIIRDSSVKEIHELKENQKQLEQELRELLDLKEARGHEILYSSTNDAADIACAEELPCQDLAENRTEKCLPAKDEPTCDVIVRKSREKKKPPLVDDRPPWVNPLDTPPSVVDHEDLVYKGEEFQNEESQNENKEGNKAEIKKASFNKKPKNYTPNTFVPNRTLQLKRANSQSKINQECAGSMFNSESRPESHSSSKCETRQNNSDLHTADNSNLINGDHKREPLPKVNKIKSGPKVWK